MKWWDRELAHNEWAAERETVARKKPHLALVGRDRRPDPDMFRWVSVADMIPVKED